MVFWMVPISWLLYGQSPMLSLLSDLPIIKPLFLLGSFELEMMIG
jgi:hypothetical protein